MRKINAQHIIGIISLIFLAGCTAQSEPPLTAAEILDQARYSEPGITVHGEVLDLGDISVCECFSVSSGEKGIQVWYDLKKDKNLDRRTLNVLGLENGDWVEVTGELIPIEGINPSTNFYATRIKKVTRPEELTVE
jgi:hypothetical protein